MSWREVKQLTRRPAGLTPAQFRVAVTIADTVNAPHDFRFWEHSESLAERCEMTAANTRKRLVELVGLGWLERVSSSRGRVPSVYEWTGEPRSLDAVATASRPVPNRVETGDQPHRENPQPRRESARGVDDTSYKEQKKNEKGTQTNPSVNRVRV